MSFFITESDEQGLFFAGDARYLSPTGRIEDVPHVKGRKFEKVDSLKRLEKLVEERKEKERESLPDKIEKRFKDSDFRDSEDNTKDWDSVRGGIRLKEERKPAKPEKPTNRAEDKPVKTARSGKVNNEA